MYVYICIFTYMQYVCIYMHTCIHNYIYIYTYIYIYFCSQLSDDGHPSSENPSASKVHMAQEHSATCGKKKKKREFSHAKSIQHGAPKIAFS